MDKEKVLLDRREHITELCNLRCFYNVDTSNYYPEHRYGPDMNWRTKKKPDDGLLDIKTIWNL